jgi:hypothetical protein
MIYRGFVLLKFNEILQLMKNFVLIHQIQT